VNDRVELFRREALERGALRRRRVVDENVDAAAGLERAGTASRSSAGMYSEPLPSVAASVCPRSGGMPVTTTLAPSRANAAAIAAPMPIALPVTSATFP